jgi:hypothetical protein
VQGVLLSWTAAIQQQYAGTSTRRGVLIPAEQIVGAGEVVPGIAQVLAVIPDAEAAWDFLSDESAFVDADKLMRPLEALR